MISFHSQLNICLLFVRVCLIWTEECSTTIRLLWLPMLTINLYGRYQKHTLTKLEQIDSDDIKRKQKKNTREFLWNIIKKLKQTFTPHSCRSLEGWTWLDRAALCVCFLAAATKTELCCLQPGLLHPSTSCHYNIPNKTVFKLMSRICS